MSSLDKLFAEPNSHFNRARSFCEEVHRSMKADWQGIRYECISAPVFSESELDGTHVDIFMDTHTISAEGVRQVKSAFFEMINLALASGAKLFVDNEPAEGVDDITFVFELVYDENDEVDGYLTFEENEMIEAQAYIEEEPPLRATFGNESRITLVFTDEPSERETFNFDNLFDELNDPNVHYNRADRFEQAIEAAVSDDIWGDLRIKTTGVNESDPSTAETTQIEVFIQNYQNIKYAGGSRIIESLRMIKIHAESLGGYLVYGKNQRKLTTLEQIEIEVHIPNGDGMGRFKVGDTSRILAFIAEHNIRHSKPYLTTAEKVVAVFRDEES